MIDIYVTIFERAADAIPIRYIPMFSFSEGGRDRDITREVEKGFRVIHNYRFHGGSLQKAGEIARAVNGLVDEANKSGRLDQSALERIFT